MSVTRAIEHSFQVKFENKSAVIKNKEKQFILVAELQSEFLFINEANGAKQLCFAKQANSLEQWHQRYRHLHFSSLNNMINKKMVYGLKKQEFSGAKLFQCVSCAKSKICVKREQNNWNLCIPIYVDIFKLFPLEVHTFCYIHR